VTTNPLTADGSVELATATVLRSGIPESRHLGVAVLVAADGAVLESHGETGAIVFPRSALKPLQALAMLEAGAPLEGDALGLATASHDGTAAHVAVVEGMLAAAGLTEHDLGCPRAWPADPTARAAAEGPRRITMVCSGKHAGFLTASVSSGATTADYLEAGHPVQRRVAAVVEDHAHERVAHWGVDGCLAPTPALSLRGFARAFGSATGSASPVRQAVVAAPWTIEGPGAIDTTIIERTGFFVKTGAEGVIAVSVPDVATVAVKVLDGSRRPAASVALTLLSRAGLLDESLRAEVEALVGSPGVEVAI